MDAFATQVTGWLFVAAAAMTWVGITFLPVPIGSFFERDDFSRVLKRLRVWIWLYRVYLFGHLVALMAQGAYSLRDRCELAASPRDLGAI